MFCMMFHYMSLSLSPSPDEPILYFQRNTFFPLKDERKLIDPKKDNKRAIDLLYHEVNTPLMPEIPVVILYSGF